MQTDIVSQEAPADSAASQEATAGRQRPRQQTRCLPRRRRFRRKQCRQRPSTQTVLQQRRNRRRLRRARQNRKSSRRRRAWRLPRPAGRRQNLGEAARQLPIRRHPIQYLPDANNLIAAMKKTPLTAEADSISSILEPGTGVAGSFTQARSDYQSASGSYESRAQSYEAAISSYKEVIQSYEDMALYGLRWRARVKQLWSRQLRCRRSRHSRCSLRPRRWRLRCRADRERYGQRQPALYRFCRGLIRLYGAGCGPRTCLYADRRWDPGRTVCRRLPQRHRLRRAL